ncbi:uncharacterized protein LOC144451100 isoform X3 [Glandiceps talaboti]
MLQYSAEAQNSSNTTNNSGHSVLTENCRPNWSESVCMFANICGFVSTAIWFVVLFPQLVKNWRRKSVVGLSILWATANFTASLIGLFFVFRIGELPLYIKISAVYMPTLECAILVQFLMYGSHYSSKAKWIYLVTCFVLWAAIILVEVITDVYEEMQWGAIVLWSIETFPQVILNMQRVSTSGQSSKSVCLALFGKTTDFLSTYLLVLPIQSVIMIYFSSTMAYINGIQVFWYWRNRNLATPELPHSNVVVEGPNQVHPNDDDDEQNYTKLSNEDVSEPILDVTSEAAEKSNEHTNNQICPIEVVVCSVPARFTLMTFLSFILAGYLVALMIPASEKYQTSKWDVVYLSLE